MRVVADAAGVPHEVPGASVGVSEVAETDANAGAEMSEVAGEVMTEATEKAPQASAEATGGSEISISEDTPLAMAQRARMRALGELSPRTKMRREAAQKRAEARARAKADAEARYDAQVNAAREALRGVALESQAHVDTVAFLLRACPRKYKKQFIEMRNSSGATALHGACAHGYAASARLLLDECASILVRDSAGRNAVDYAFLYGHDELARELCAAYERASGLVYTAEGLRDQADDQAPQAAPLRLLRSALTATKAATTTRGTLPQVAVSTMRGSALWGEEAESSAPITDADMHAFRDVAESEWVCIAANAGDVDQVIRLLGAGCDLSSTLSSRWRGGDASEPRPLVRSQRPRRPLCGARGRAASAN